LYPIPGPRFELTWHEGLATSEWAWGEPGEEGKPMAETLKGKVQRVQNWLHGYHVPLVILLSVMHFRLAFTSARDSGRADSHHQMQIP